MGDWLNAPRDELIRLVKHYKAGLEEALESQERAWTEVKRLRGSQVSAHRRTPEPRVNPSEPHKCPVKACTCPKCQQCSHPKRFHCPIRGCQVILHFDKTDGFLLCGCGPGELITLT